MTIVRNREKEGMLLTGGFIMTLVFFFVVALGAVYSIEDVSMEENRVLAKKPVLDMETYFSGEVHKAWDAYLSDHIPHRNLFIRQAESLAALKELRRDVKLVSVTADIGASPDVNGASAMNDTQKLLILNDRLLEVYRYDKDNSDYYTETINRFAERVPAGIRVYSMLVPMRIEFEDEKYRKLADSQSAAIRSVYDSYDLRVETVDAYSLLQRHKDEYIYFRTDHHWTALGAYYGMRAFANAAGFNALEIREYSETVLDGFFGYLFKMSPDDEVKKFPDSLCYYTRNGRNNISKVYFYDDDGMLQSYRGTMFNMDVLKYNVSYGVFLGGDFPLIEIEGDKAGGRVLAIVKDSYGNAFTPWLTPYFSRIMVIDPRTLKEDFNKLLREKGVTDLLILDYTKVTMLPSFIDSLNGLTE